MAEQLALDLIPSPGGLETVIQRVPAGQLNSALREWKGLRQHGWDVTALVSPDRKTIVMLACRGG